MKGGFQNSSADSTTQGLSTVSCSIPWAGGRAQTGGRDRQEYLYWVNTSDMKEIGTGGGEACKGGGPQLCLNPAHPEEAKLSGSACASCSESKLRGRWKELGMRERGGGRAARKSGNSSFLRRLLQRNAILGPSEGCQGDPLNGTWQPRGVSSPAQVGRQRASCLPDGGLVK